MAEDNAVEVLVKAFEESMTSARQAEDQRATITNFLVTIAAALLAFIVQKDFSPATLALSLFIIAIGLFGMLASIKFAQHYHVHWTRADLFQKRLDELCPEAQLETIRNKGSETNQSRYPILRRRIPILYLWLILHTTIAVLGIGCAIAVLSKIIRPEAF